MFEVGSKVKILTGYYEGFSAVVSEILLLNSRPRYKVFVLPDLDKSGALYEQSELELESQKKHPDFETKKKENHEKGRKYDQGKPMYGLLPADALEEVVKVLTYGAYKYNEPLDQENWRNVPDAQPRYFNATQRHLWAHKKGQHIDDESGLWHLAHAISSQLFMLQLLIEERNKALEQE